jgi:Na+-transporting NADH:ubiquinone oxidoreductase subunit NqrB
VKLLWKFIARLFAALLLVFATFNPTGYSYLHWVVYAPGRDPWLKLTVGLGLGMLYYAVIGVALSSLRRSGFAVGVVVSLMFSVEIVAAAVPRWLYQSWSGSLLVAEYVLLVSFAIVLAFGTSWSSLIEKLTGQQQQRYIGGPPTTPVPP